MRRYEEKQTQLLSLMEEASHVCLTLYEYTKERFALLSGYDDEKIIQLINDREVFIHHLMKLEHRIGLIEHSADDHNSGVCLPCDMEERRKSIKKVLHEVTAMDARIMRHLSIKIQYYKNETLNARSKNTCPTI